MKYLMRNIIKFACLFIVCLAVSCIVRHKGGDPFYSSIINGVPWIKAARSMHMVRVL